MLYRHLAAILVVALLASPAVAEDPDAATTAKAHLEEAYGLENDAVIVEAIEEAAGIDDPAVVKLVAQGIRSKSPAVIRASLTALGKTPGDAALKALHDTYRRVRTKKLDGYEDLFALLLQEIGRHGDPSSVDDLKDKPFKNLTYDVGLARIMGLGNIRTPEAVGALVELSRKSGGRGSTGVVSAMRGKFREALRVAMATLTGVDQGTVPADWDRWWRENEKSFEMAEERPQVPDDVAEYWSAYWGKPYYSEGAEPAAPRMGSPIVRYADPSKEQVKEAVDALKAAFKTRDDDDIVAALEAYGGVLDKKVVHEVAAGLRSKSRTVKMASLEVLGWMKYEPALKQLHRFFRRTKSKWDEDEGVFEVLLKAIGRHGDPSSVKVLAESPFKGLTLATGRARILGQANIRTKDAVESLIKGSQLAGSNPPRSWRPAGDKRFVKEFDIALTILTGQEFGSDLVAWQTWWRKNKKTFEVSPTRPQIPAWMQKAWDEYWLEPYYGE